ncbi:MAG: immunoglobulin-like domain-containing protein [bacterium]
MKVKSLSYCCGMVAAGVYLGMASITQVQAAVDNYINNSGAENGVSPWVSFGGGPALQASSVQAKSGINSFLIAGRTQFYHGPSYTIKPLIDNGQLVAGKRYQASVWVRHGESTAQTLHLNIKTVDGSGTNYDTIEKRTVPPNKWVQISGFYTPNITGNLSSLDLYVVSTSGTNFDFYSDDFFLGELEDYDPPTASNPSDFVRASGHHLVVGANNETILFKGINVTVPVDGDNNSEDVWKTKAISLANFQNIKDIGFNAIRLHLNYKTFEDDAAPYVYKEDGWHWLDRAISFAKQTGLYVMLDMHGPQGGYQSDKTPGFSAFWDGSGAAPNTSNQNRLIALWKAIATRYRHEPIILGYDFINEPRPNFDEEWYSFAEQIIAQVRSVDPDHMIVMETPLISGWTMRTVNDDNVLYDSHTYTEWGFTTQYSTHYGKAGQRWGKYDSPENPIGASYNIDYLRTDMHNEILDFVLANNVPLDTGEYGVVHEAFPEDVNAVQWVSDMNKIMDGYNDGGIPINRFYFSYQGGTFGLYPNWSGFHADDIAANQDLKNYWINYLGNDETPDTIPPVITLLGQPLINLTVGDSYSDAGATANDNRDGDVSNQIMVTGSVDTNTVGDYTLRYNVSDAAGNAAAEITRHITVAEDTPPLVDTTAPVITLLGNSTVTLTEGDRYSDAGATASDNIDGNITNNIVVSNPVDTAKAGTYTVRYNVSDAAGNAATEVTRTVTVNAAPTTGKQADLRISFRKTYPSGSPDVGRAVGYEVITYNDGGDTVMNTLMAMTVPAGTIWQSGSSGCTLTGTQVLCELGDIGDGQRRTRTLYIKAMQAGDFTVSAKATSATNDPNIGNEEASITITVNGTNNNDSDDTTGDGGNTSEPPSSDENADLRLTLQKTYPSNPKLGRAVGYRLKTFNDGPDAATNLVTRLIVPQGTEWVSGSSGCAMTGNEVVCQLGHVGSGQRRTRNIYVRPAQSGDFVVTARTASDTNDSHTTNNEQSLSVFINP